MTRHQASGRVPASVLEAKEVTKTFPGTVALDRVNFRIEPGRVHALIGENGAGKSTLVKILAGIERPTAGRLLLNGEEVQFTSARHAAACGIGLIHQELQLFPNLTIAENLFVGRERTNRWGLVDTAAQQSAAAAVLGRLGQTLDPSTLVGALPLGVMQIVEIARALVHNTRILMMDEPTSALTPPEVDVLFQIIRDLTARGVSIVYISHRLEELLAVADEVTVLRDGRGVGEALAAEIDVRWIVERMAGREPRRSKSRTAFRRGRTMLSVRDLTLAPRPGRSALAGVSFDLHAGEVLGIYGLMGAGRTELFETLLGVHEDASGEIVLEGRDLGPLDLGARVRAGLVMVPEDRQKAGLFTSMSVLENMTVSGLHLFSRFGWLSRARETRAASRLTDDLRISTPAMAAPVTVLSGGNQQKVVISRGVMVRPRVLFMDEPTRGVDVAAKAEITQCMRQLADEGMAVVFASSDVGEVGACADRVLVMTRGRIVGDYAPSEATEHTLASAASTLDSVSRSAGL
ncbi:MAG: sugar ABC transporter ATP-binding protein [Vicinamibacteraceae bacterium]